MTQRYTLARERQSCCKGAQEIGLATVESMGVLREDGRMKLHSPRPVMAQLTEAAALQDEVVHHWLAQPVKGAGIILEAWVGSAWRLPDGLQPRSGA